MGESLIMQDREIKEFKRIGAFREWKEFTVEYIQLVFGDKKNLIVSLLFPIIAAIIVVWIAGENMFNHYDGTKSGNFSSSFVINLFLVSSLNLSYSFDLIII